MVKDYQRGKIYKIVCNITDKTYIGSTCEPTLARRLAKHVSCFRRWKKDNKHSYISSFQIIEEGDYYIDLLELFPCSSGDELRKKEREYYDKITCCNKFKPYISEEETKEVKKVYRINNIDKIKESKKEYRINNIDKIKEYRINNIDKIKESKKEYRKKNYTCEHCSKELSLNHKSDHEKTLKHINNINLTNQLNQ